jgi:ferrochelatase
VIFVESWHDDPGLIAFLADRIRDTDAHVVFTAHSLPERILVEGDPYKDQLLETARLVADSAGVEDWSFSFQSESPTGEPWLGTEGRPPWQQIFFRHSVPEGSGPEI